LNFVQVWAEMLEERSECQNVDAANLVKMSVWMLMDVLCLANCDYGLLFCHILSSFLSHNVLISHFFRYIHLEQLLNIDA